MNSVHAPGAPSYRETGHVASAIGDEAAGRTSSRLAVPRLPALEDVVHDPRPARLGEELGTEADQPAGRHEVLHTGPACAVVDHLLHPALPERKQLRDDADVVLRDVDGDPFDRLVLLAIEHARQHLRLAHGELEPLAPHDLDEDGELELSAPLYLPDIGARRRLHAQRDVPDELALERAISALAVTLSPSVPASGDVFIPRVIARDGSSTVLTGRGVDRRRPRSSRRS